MVADCATLPAQQQAGTQQSPSYWAGIAVDLLIKLSAEQIATCLEGRYMAILLVGGAARGESTFAKDGSLESDLDLLVVLPQRNVLMAILEEKRCRRLLQSVEGLYSHGRKVDVSVGFANSTRKYWRVATPFMWELRTNSRVLYGLGAVRDWPHLRRASQIPRWEGIRLIANRMCELLAELGSMHQSGTGSHTEQKTRYCCLKLAVACSEAMLIDRHEYKGSYRERHQQHLLTARMFSPEHRALIDAAYRVKLGSVEGIELDTTNLVRATLKIALWTLGQCELMSPGDIEHRALTERPAAPGLMSDLLFYIMARRTGKRVPLRRAIAPVYASAFHLARQIACDPSRLLQDEHITDRCRRIAEEYKRTPQVVSIIQRQRA